MDAIIFGATRAAPQRGMPQSSSMDESVKLTIFTPTYNRVQLLSRTFESLMNQSRQDFVWLIVDDGSKDDTREVVRGFKERAAFEIAYHYQENGGKMRAHNKGVSLAKTELFLCLDSDDVLTPDAVEAVLHKWEEFNRCHFCMKQSARRAGIVAYKGLCRQGLDFYMAEGEKAQVEEFSGSAFDPGTVERGYSTLRGLYLGGFKGETTLVFRTELLKKYPFPEINGEKYVPEDYIYDKIDSVCPLLVLDRILTVCELVEGGYTQQAARLRRDNPVGWLMYYEQRSRIQDWSLLKLKYMSHYMRFCSVTGRKCTLSLPERIAATPGALLLRLLGKT